MLQPDRRRFLRHALAWPLGLQTLQWSSHALATAGPDYKALVCVFLMGGNDAYNTVLATDDDSWRHYQDHRNPASRQTGSDTASIALLPVGTPPDLISSNPLARLGGVLPLPTSSRPEHTGRSFGLHPSLARSAALYEAGRLAVVANVGPLLAPMSKSQWLDEAVAKPGKLFSHIDQQSTWQSFRPQGDGDGWGGRMADLLMPTQLDEVGMRAWRALACMTPSNEALWLSGRHMQPCFTSPTHVLTLGQQGRLMDSSALHDAVRSVMRGAEDEAHLLRQAHQEAARRGFDASDLLAPNLPGQFVAPWGTPGASNIWNDPLLQYDTAVGGGTNDLAVQLQMVARLIEANRSASAGVNRQMFFVTLSGFDTHDRQSVQHALRLAQLDHALSYFDGVLADMPGGDLRSRVTTFTCSEFGRAFTNNGDGSDHGWGGHHLVMGGAVRGGHMHGRFPTYATADASGQFDSPDQIHNGVLLPSLSVDQYAATLGSWMGLSDNQLLSLMPNLAQFPTEQRRLGFMAA
ncbi:MAG: hypothetical protein RI907_645 [Pseudomonadota bacterium]|jgi:uncharacterized protein (DUF1501 family)